MENVKYTVTFKIVDPGARFYKNSGKNEIGHSIAGHIWYVLERSDSNDVKSYGFQSVTGKSPIGKGFISTLDDGNYFAQDVRESITIQLNSVQYNNLLSLGKGKGFDDSYYNVATHNCVSYVFKALHVIGYNPQDINMGTRLTDWILSNPVSSALAYSNMGFLVNAVVWQTINGAPSLIYDDLTQLLAANGAIAVEGNRLFPVPGNTLNVNNKIIGYSNIDDVIIGGIGDDHLIGKDGNDILIGDKILPKVEVGLISDEDLLERALNKGKDILEGGEGYDTYYVNHGDIIIDSDGKGEIRFQDKESNYFTGDEHVGYFGRITGIRGDNAKFIGNDSNGIAYAYVLNGLSFDGKNFSAASLVMTNLETEHQITIRNFKNGHLNIYLNDLIYFDREIHAISYYFDTSENLFNTYDVDPHSGWARLKHGGDRNDASDLDANGGDTSNHGSSNTRRESAGRGAPNQGKRKLQLYDPLVLDLDGDGIETVGHNGHSGSLFDHDADGIRTSTGWIKGDYGLLVLDKDGDGKITNASELFSDMVILSDSTRAQHGFSALKDLDSNDDGVIDKQDTKFSELKLWRDLNQNGISEENELFNLSDFAIKSLHTAYEDRYDEVAGDNILSQLGKYEKEDGSFGAMADINFSFNPFYSDFAEKLKLTEEQERIINLRGIGRVRDLREAATLSTELNVLLQQYTIAKTREEQHALLPTILQKWAQTDNKYQSYSLHLEKTVEDSSPDAQVIRLTPSQLSALRNAQHDPAVMQRFEDNKSKISTINSLYSMNIAQLYYTTDEDIDYITDKINRIYNNLIQLAYESLLLQTRLKKYVDSVGFLYKDGVLSRDYSYTVQLFNETFAESPSNALTDLSEYIVLLKNPREWYEGLLLLNQYFEAVEKEGLIEDWKANSSTILNKLERKRIFFSKGFSLNGDQGNDKFLSNITNNVNDRTGNDIFFGSLNDDRLYGGEGDDHLYGGLGDDRLYGGEGEDYLEGGVGQDILEGGQGSDTYVFSKGHGQDILKDEANYGARDIDRLIFTDVALNEVKFRQEGEDLVLFGYHKEDSLRLKYFYSDARYKLEHITFADQSFDLASLRQVTLPLFGSAEDDTINDWSGNSRIEAGAGNDVVRGNDGNDILLGGLGDDRLYGGEGEDYLEGGVGQDILEGGQGSDTYVFSKGHGQDIIEDYSFNHFDSDIIRFVDVNIPEKLWFSRRDNNLLITNLDTADTLTVNNWYLSQNYQIERIELSDGRSLGSSQVEKLVSAMAEFDVEHSGDVLSVPQDEMRKYLNTLSVATYYS